MREVIVVGAGVVGTSLARELSRHPEVTVTVIEREPDRLRGSTAFAPGFVGLFNEAPVLTELARATAEVYDAAGHGFRRAGGFELATTAAGAGEIERRATAARALGLPVSVAGSSSLPAPVAEIVDTTQVTVAAHYSADGVAVPLALVARLREQAEDRGARFVPGTAVTGIDQHKGKHVVRTDTGDPLVADDVVLAGGIWGPQLAALVGVELPLHPVAHPYVYSAADPTLPPGPFVRWPEHHVYARVHSDRLGIGSYDHRPRPVDPEQIAGGAGLSWCSDFDSVIETAQSLLREDRRFTASERVNGVFAMTPDNLPFVGAHPSLPGVWIAQAIWITHAAGAAATLARMMIDGVEPPAELEVSRFDGRAPAELETAALKLYRDIYANDAPAPV